jgi:hypothetical protein
VKIGFTGSKSMARAGEFHLRRIFSKNLPERLIPKSLVDATVQVSPQSMLTNKSSSYLADTKEL